MPLWPSDLPKEVVGVEAFLKSGALTVRYRFDVTWVTCTRRGTSVGLDAENPRAVTAALRALLVAAGASVFRQRAPRRVGVHDGIQLYDRAFAEFEIAERT